MNLKQLTNEVLEQNLVELVAKERELLCVIIRHVMEIERRRAYVNSKASLFEYLKEICNYTHGTTQRRIDAAMLALEIPEILLAIKSGKLNQSQITCAQVAFRHSAKQNKKKVSKELKLQVINSILGKTEAESEILIAAILGIKPKSKTKIKRQADGSVAVQTTFTKEQWEVIENAKALLSHSVPTGNFNELTTYMAERVVAYKTKLTSAKMQRQQSKAATEIPTGISHLKNGALIPRETARRTEQISTASFESSEQIPASFTKSTEQIPAGIAEPARGPRKSPPAPTSKGFRQNYHLQPAREYIPAHIRRVVFAQQKCCQHKDPATGKMCGSRWQMQIDHIQPVWAGGTNEIANLQVLCGVHNRLAYRKQANFRAVTTYARI